MDDAINDLVVQLVDYDISEWKADGEGDDWQNTEPEVDNDGPPIRKLFVGNIRDRTSYLDLRKLFRHYGKVVDAHISRDRYTHSKKNYGFVTFRDPEDAKRVLKLKHGELTLHSRNLFVAPADSWHQPKELPDGTILWNNKQKNSEKIKSQNEVVTSSATDSATDEQELGAVGGCSPQSVQKQEENVANMNGTENPAEDGECKIDSLNDDCLIHVFSFLGEVERIRIERVCKRWQSISLGMWLSYKNLDFSFLVIPRFLNMRIFEEYLRRCGSNLQTLDLSYKPSELTASIHRIIASYCTNLRCLNLSGLPVTSGGLHYLGTVCIELRVLNLDGCCGLADRDLQIFFRKCPNLESVTLSHSGLTGKCLSGLSRAPVKRLVLDECNNFRYKYLVNGLSGLMQLVHLSINSCGNLTTIDVLGILGAVPHLHSLSMARYFPLFNTSTLKPLALLSDLVYLNLQLNPAVNDSIMRDIAKSCKKLEQINVTGCNSHSSDLQCLSNDGIKCLASLPRFVSLSMSYLGDVTDEALESLACKGRLRSLVCRGCPNFTDVGCISIVTSCNELEKFDFSGCDLVSKATIQAALDSVKLRTNDIKLTLIIGGTCASEERISIDCPLLEVDYSDLCISHLRPDFVDDIYFPPSESEDEESDFVQEWDLDWEWECHSIIYGDLESYDEDSYDGEW